LVGDLRVPADEELAVPPEPEVILDGVVDPA